MLTDSKPVAVSRAADAPSAFQEALVEWFRREGKTYPWRETTDPYAILVSEFMLQQTQITTVLNRGYFHRWMSQFPDISSLAKAPEEAVLRVWEGLGYYRRARNLHRLAQVVLAEHDGKLPETVEGILALPGIGPYTAGAVLSFAHDRSVPLVDGNVLRVFARLFDYRDEVDQRAGQKQMWSWAEMLVPSAHARHYNSGLMELGQRVCLQKQPLCQTCPVSQFCQTRQPEALPNKSKRRSTVFLDEHVLFHLDAAERLLLVKEEGRRRQGLWKLPECPEEHCERLALVYKAKYSITHHRVTLHVHEGQGKPVTQGSWVSLTDVPTLAMASPYRKAVDLILKELSDFRLKS